MVELTKKATSAITPIAPSAIVEGLVGVTLLKSNVPYPDRTKTPALITVMVAHS